MLQRSSTDTQLDGQVVQYAFDNLPVVGKSTKFRNLYYNFGGVKQLKKEDKFKVYVSNAKYLSHMVLHDLGIEEQAPDTKYYSCMSPSRKGIDL